MAFRSAARSVLETLDLQADGITSAECGVDELLRRARRLWRASPLSREPAALGVSSWEALWSDLHQDSPTSPPHATDHAETIWRQVLTALGGDPAQARFAAQLLITRREALVCPYPGSREALQRLSAHHRLWVVTHGSSALQRRKLHLAGLKRYFEQIYISAEVGHVKEEPEFANLLQERAHASGRTIRAVIGDSVSDLTLATHGLWPAIHICPPTCTLGEPTILHRRTLADCPALD